MFMNVLWSCTLFAELKSKTAKYYFDKQTYHNMNMLEVEAVVKYF